MIPERPKEWSAYWLSVRNVVKRGPRSWTIQVCEEGCMMGDKLQALVYDILPSTTAVFSYATGSRKLSANEKFFVGFFFGAQTVVSLLQTTQIKQGVSFIAANKVYTSTHSSGAV